jgi:hypothetical protein
MTVMLVMLVVEVSKCSCEVASDVMISLPSVMNSSIGLRVGDRHISEHDGAINLYYLQEVCGLVFNVMQPG